jgi:hypothetical protein
MTSRYGVAAVVESPGDGAPDVAASSGTAPLPT